SPSAAPIGGAVVISGSGFSATASSNSVTFAGAGGVRVAASITQAASTSLTVVVPAQSATGSVTVAVSGLVSNSAAFTVTSPVLTTVIPSTITTNVSGSKQVTLMLTGSGFVPGATVAFGGPAADISPVGAPLISADGTTITLAV